MITIIEDTRQQEYKHEHVNKWFIEHNINVLRSKLPIGDYALLSNMSVIIDTKKDVIEIAGNIMQKQEHERFRNELIKAKENGIKLYILIEDDYIFNIDGLKYYKMPTYKSNQYKKINGINILVKKKGEPIANFKPEILAKCMKTMEEKYGCSFKFTKKENTAQMILKLLGVDING